MEDKAFLRIVAGGRTKQVDSDHRQRLPVRFGLRLTVVCLLAALALYCCLMPGSVLAVEARVSIMHYFADDLGKDGMTLLLERFEEKSGTRVVQSPVGHEEFKNRVLEMAAKGYLQDVISYWAGARAQFLVDSGVLDPLDDLWDQKGYGRIIPPALADSASLYNGHRYLVPFGYHCVGFFYSPAVFRKAGIHGPPKTWDAFLHDCARLQDAGVQPIALGAKNRWPAQFWFDYLLLRTAGNGYRNRLMNGNASYTDPEVVAAVEAWKEILDRGYMGRGTTVEGWTDAADRVTGGKAAMTLMGTWITGYWNRQGFRQGTDYDFFKFPVIDPAVPEAVVGPVDGFMVSADSKAKNKAMALIDYLLTDTEAQETWIRNQGALSPNTSVDTTIYDPVMLKALEAVRDAGDFAFNYDLATTPPMAEKGLGFFYHFLNNPDRYRQQLEQTQAVAGSIFSVGKSGRQD